MLNLKRTRPEAEHDFAAVEKLLDAAMPSRPRVYSWVPVARFCTVAVVLTGCASVLTLVGLKWYNNDIQPPLPPGTYERAILTVNENGRVVAVVEGEAPPALPPGSYVNAQVTVNEKGQITEIARGPKLAPGVHNLTTVIVDDEGQITSVTSGSVPVQPGGATSVRAPSLATTSQGGDASGRITMEGGSGGVRVATADEIPNRRPALIEEVKPPGSGSTPNPAPGGRTELRHDASADEAAIWCRQTYPATIQDWCFDAWVHPRKLIPGQTERAETTPEQRGPAITNPRVQEEINRTSGGGKIVTNYTIFRTVNWKRGTVETGWRFPNNTATAPDNQWCYYRWRNPATNVTSNLDMGGEATPAAISPAGLTTAEYREGQNQCVWFNNTKPRTS